MLFFLVIVAVPFAIVLLSLFRPDLIEQVIREPASQAALHRNGRPDQPDKSFTS